MAEHEDIRPASAADIKRLASLLYDPQKDAGPVLSQLFERKFLIGKTAVKLSRIEEPGSEKIRISAGIATIPSKNFSTYNIRRGDQFWIIVSGIGHIELDDRKTILSRNEEIFIPNGSVCRIYNPLAEPLEFIFVQSSAPVLFNLSIQSIYLECDTISNAGEQPRAATGHVSKKSDVFADTVVRQFIKDEATAASMYQAFARAGYRLIQDSSNVTEFDLPKTAPKRWVDRNTDDPQNPSQFIKKYYGTWLPHSLAQQDLYDLDFDLYSAYTGRTRKDRHPEERITFAPKKPRKDKLADAELGRRQRSQSNASKAKARSRTVRTSGPRMT